MHLTTVGNQFDMPSSELMAYIHSISWQLSKKFMCVYTQRAKEQSYKKNTFSISNKPKLVPGGTILGHLLDYNSQIIGRVIVPRC